MKANAVYFGRSHYMTLKRAADAGVAPPNAHATRTRVGSRGGNVRSIEHARELHESFKGDWTEKVRLHMARTLVETGALHADDLDALQVPAAHANIAGSQFGSFCSRGLMEPTGVERKVAHAAANFRKGKIFRITEKGRRELPKMLARIGATEGKQGEGSAGGTGRSTDAPAPSTGSGTALDGTPLTSAPTSVGADPGENAEALFELPDERSSASPYSAEAA